MANERAVELRRWRNQVLEELEAFKRDLAALQRQIRDSEQRLQLVDELLSLEEPTGSMDRNDGTDAPGELLDECERVMTELGRPIHIRELHALLLERGVPVPGRGTEANLIVRLQRSDGRFVRVGRGTYAPIGMRLPEKKPAKKRKTTRRLKGNST